MSNKITKEKRKINIEKIDIIIFFMVLFIFGISLLSFFPGILTSDGVDQIYQARYNTYNDAHPVFHTFIVGNLAKLSGIWVPALFQIIVFALIWTYACKSVRKYNYSLKNKIFQLIFTFIICIIPLNFLYSITLWKDILYSYSMLLLLILIFIGIKEDYKYTNFQIILISLSNVLIMKFRHNGVPIGLLMFLILLIMNLVKNRNIKTFIKFIMSFVLIFMVLSLPQKLVKASKSSDIGGAFDSTKIYCIAALLNSNVQFDKNEIEFINTILDAETLKNTYNPYSAYYSKEVHNTLKIPENEEKLNKIFIKYATKNPKIIFKHFSDVNSIWWDVKEQGGMHSVVLTNSWISDISNGEFDNHPILEKGNILLNEYTNYTMSTTFKYELFYRPAVLIIVSVICIILIFIFEKKKSYILMLFPMVLNIGTYILLICSQDHRYFYPNYMTGYMLIIICASLLKSNKNVHIVRESKKIDNPKTLLIIPAYNEEDNILNTYNEIVNYNKKNRTKYDVIVINDGSSDNTSEICYKNKIPTINLINNLGIGGAVQTGYKYAYEKGYDIAVQFDGDGQHDINYVKNIIDPLINGEADFVIGSRFIKRDDENFKSTFTRRIGINIISFFIKLFTDTKIYDTTSGFRAVNKEIIEYFSTTYPTEYPEPVSTTELLNMNYNVKEVQVKMNERLGGVSSIRTWKSAYYMLNVILSIIMIGARRDR